MNDELLMNNYLMILKSTIEVYIHGTIESYNKKVRELLNDLLEETIKSQEKTFNYMVESDWYNTDNIDPKKICKCIESINRN